MYIYIITQSIRVCETPTVWHGFNLCKGHIYGDLTITDGKKADGTPNKERYWFVTAGRPSKHTLALQTYICKRAFRNTDYCKEWDKFYIPFNTKAHKIIADTLYNRNKNGITKVTTPTIEEQFAKNPHRYDARGNGKEWIDNAVFGFNPDRRAQSVGVATEYFTAEEKITRGYKTLKRWESTPDGKFKMHK